MKKPELLEILEQFDDNVNIRVQFNHDLEEVEAGDCFNITDIDCTEQVIYLQVW